MKNALDNMRMIALQTDINANIIYCNDYFVSFTGWTREEIIGANWFDKFYPPQSVPAAKAALKEAIKRNSLNTHFEGQIIIRTGEIKEIFWNDTMLKDNAGNIQGIISFGQDVTESKKLEKSLRENKKRLDLAIEAGKIGLYELDLVHNTSWRSLRHDRIFGYDTLLPKWTLEMLIEHVIPEDRAEVTLLTRQAIAKSISWDVQCRIKRKDGAVRWIWAKGDPEINKRNEVIKVVGVVKDITEWKKAQESLRNSELKYRRLFESNKSGILIVDAETGQIDDVNFVMLNLLGYTQREILRKKLWELGSLKDTIANQKGYRQLLEKEYNLLYNLALETKDGQKLYGEFDSSVFMIGQKKMIQCNLRNISDRKRLRSNIS